MTEQTKTQVPKRIYIDKQVYTILGNYNFKEDHVEFNGHKGYSLVGRKRVESLNLKMADIKWFEYSSLEGIKSIRGRDVEFQTFIYRKWFNMFGDRPKDMDNYVSWSEFYEGERERIL